LFLDNIFSKDFLFKLTYNGLYQTSPDRTFFFKAREQGCC